VWACQYLGVVESLIEIPDSAEPASWLADGIVGFGESVVSLVPRGFEGYARVFHPADIYDPRKELGSNVDVTWTDVAHMMGRIAHPRMEWESILRIDPDRGRARDDFAGGVWHGDVRIQDPMSGRLPEAVAASLVNRLRGETTTPKQCWFGVWDGWGGLSKFVSAAPAFDLPHRRYHLLSGPIERVATLTASPPWRDPPSLWWPSDHAWCVATEIDFDTTYVGASEAGIEHLLACEGLEVYRVEPANRLGSDDLNPSPAAASL
jgi:hypothetical protein